MSKTITISDETAEILDQWIQDGQYTDPGTSLISLKGPSSTSGGVPRSPNSSRVAAEVLCRPSP